MAVLQLDSYFDVMMTCGCGCRGGLGLDWVTGDREAVSDLPTGQIAAAMVFREAGCSVALYPSTVLQQIQTFCATSGKTLIRRPSLLCTDLLDKYVNYVSLPCNTALLDQTT